MQTTQLNAKAMLVKLTTRRANLSHRDKDAEAFVQQALDDAGLAVVRKLFRDPNNPINTIVSLASSVCTHHRNRTLPYIDRGPRLLPNAQYMDYTKEMRQRIAEVDNALANYMPYYDQYVQKDIDYRSKGQSSKRASVTDYPTADEFKSRIGFDLRFMPLPDRRHFLFDMSEEDEVGMQKDAEQAAALARNHVVQVMLTPVKHLVAKLGKQIGEEGSVFRDSAVENIVESVEQAKKLVIDDQDGTLELVKELEASITPYVDKINWLRESPINRDAARAKLEEVMSKMGNWMGATNG